MYLKPLDMYRNISFKNSVLDIREINGDRIDCDLYLNTTINAIEHNKEYKLRPNHDAIDFKEGVLGLTLRTTRIDVQLYTDYTKQLEEATKLQGNLSVKRELKKELIMYVSLITRRKYGLPSHIFLMEMSIQPFNYREVLIAVRDERTDNAEGHSCFRYDLSTSSYSLVSGNEHATVTDVNEVIAKIKYILDKTNLTEFIPILLRPSIEDQQVKEEKVREQALIFKQAYGSELLLRAHTSKENANMIASRLKNGVDYVYSLFGFYPMGFPKYFVIKPKVDKTLATYGNKNGEPYVSITLAACKASEEFVYAQLAHELGHMFHAHCIAESNPWSEHNKMLEVQLELELKQYRVKGVPLYLSELIRLYGEKNTDTRIKANNLKYYSSATEYIARAFELLVFKQFDRDCNILKIHDKYRIATLTDIELEICTHYISQMKFATDS